MNKIVIPFLFGLIGVGILVSLGFLKKPKDIAVKIKAYSHQEFNKEDFVDEKKIAKRIENKQDLFNRNIAYKKIEVDETYPKYIFDNKAMFKEWII